MTSRAGSNDYPVYLEIGEKRVFAGAIEWPGWARSGRDADGALAALFEYAPRYARVLEGTRLGFKAPEDPSALSPLERLPGTASTDFGALDASPSLDGERVRESDLRRFSTLCRAAWRAFDRAVEGAQGLELVKGPRGGGRDLYKIVDHVLGSEESYLRMIGAKAPKGDQEGRSERVRSAVLEGLAVAARDGVPPSPRGGKRWTPRFFVRRLVWHALDHAWEIEDRTTP